MILAKSKDEVSKDVAVSVISQITEKPDSLLGLPTGRTPLNMYEHIKELTRKRNVDWSQAQFFGLDEYLDTDRLQSFKYYLETNVYGPLKISEKNCSNPLTIVNYDNAIESMGGLDLTVLGIGTNGHIAFNEPPTSELSWTHCVWLTESTKDANMEFFESPEIVPDKAVTMGIQTLLSSRRLILMAFGSHKKEILERALKGPVDPLIPASYLQKHQNLEIYTDFEFSI